jgi:hypothetical protein
VQQSAGALRAPGPCLAAPHLERLGQAQLDVQLVLRAEVEDLETYDTSGPALGSRDVELPALTFLARHEHDCHVAIAWRRACGLSGGGLQGDDDHRSGGQGGQAERPPQ